MSYNRSKLNLNSKISERFFSLMGPMIENTLKSFDSHWKGYNMIYYLTHSDDYITLPDLI